MVSHLTPRYVRFHDTVPIYLEWNRIHHSRFYRFCPQITRFHNSPYWPKYRNSPSQYLFSNVALLISNVSQHALKEIVLVKKRAILTILAEPKIPLESTPAQRAPLLPLDLPPDHLYLARIQRRYSLVSEVLPRLVRVIQKVLAGWSLTSERVTGWPSYSLHCSLDSLFFERLYTMKTWTSVNRSI